MDTLLKTILIISIAVFSVSALGISFAQAQSGLQLEFEGAGNTLFSENNFAPGENITKWIKVTNTSGENQEIGIEVIDYSSCSGICLSDKLALVISENGLPLYFGFLTDFYNAGEIYLSPLVDGSMNQYDFSITFISDAGDDYQNSDTSFDFKIGFWGESISGEVPPGGPTGGTGGVFIAGLQIFDEAATPDTDSVVITWTTSKFSTSRVIFSADNETYSFDWTNPPNYGYLHSTVEVSKKVTGHSVTVGGLTSGTTYYFRCVSHASPSTIGTEHSFATLAIGETTVEGDAGDAGDGAEGGDEQETGDDAGNIGDTGDAGAGDANDDAGAGVGAEEPGTGIGDIGEEEEEWQALTDMEQEFKDEGVAEDDTSKFLASIGTFFSNLEGWRLILFFLLGIILALLILRLFKAWISKRE